MIQAHHPLLAWGLQKYAALRFHTSGDARLLPLSFRLKKNHISRFAECGALEARLAQIDKRRPIRRVFVMGCGRSGTWLLTGLMATFKDTCVVAKEVPVELFGQVTTTGETLVLKRNNVSYERLARIPSRIMIAYAIRHPFDVLTSHNPTSARDFHISPKRWLGEMQALRAAMESCRENLSIVRYEDMVTDAETVQSTLARELSLEIASSPENLAAVFKPSGRAASAMHGLRRIDTRSLHKYKNDPDKIAYLKSITSELGETLDWVANRFGYDVSLS